MGTFLVGLAVGLFTGTCFGVFLGGLLGAAARDDLRESMHYESLREWKDDHSWLN